MTTAGEEKSWVVYRMKIHGKTTGMPAVCEQAEWEAMERTQPCHHALVVAGITNEGEAETLVRSSTVNDAIKSPRK